MLSLAGLQKKKVVLTFSLKKSRFFFKHTERKKTLLFFRLARKIAKEEEWRDHPGTRRMTSRRIISKGATRAEAE